MEEVLLEDALRDLRHVRAVASGTVARRRLAARRAETFLRSDVRHRRAFASSLHRRASSHLHCSYVRPFRAAIAILMADNLGTPCAEPHRRDRVRSRSGHRRRAGRMLLVGPDALRHYSHILEAPSAAFVQSFGILFRSINMPDQSRCVLADICKRCTRARHRVGEEPQRSCECQTPACLPGMCWRECVGVEPTRDRDAAPQRF